MHSTQCSVLTVSIQNGHTVEHERRATFTITGEQRYTEEWREKTLKRNNNNNKNAVLLIHPCNWIRLVLLHFHRNSICMEIFPLKENDSRCQRVRGHCNAFRCPQYRWIFVRGASTENDGNFTVSGESMAEGMFCMFVQT